MKPRIDRGYVGIPSFLRGPICADLDRLDAAVAILGVPFDEGSPFLPGSRMAPRALREHSLRFGSEGLFDPETGITLLGQDLAAGLIADAGDVDIAPTHVEQTFASITADVTAILARGALPVVLGGDHSITYPIVRAFPGPLHVLQFDAHMDYAGFEQGLRFTNGHAFRHIAGLDSVASLTQVGIRSLRSSRSQYEDMIAAGHRIVPMGELRALGPAGIAALLPEGAPLYVSIDVDALDMSLVPGCVSGEPNGMTYPELRETLRRVAERCAVVGFDFVEVNPPLDVGTGATAYLGALLVSEFLGQICAQPRFESRRAAVLARRAAAQAHHHPQPGDLR
ncbi:arginase family protein [Methylobacterium nonmethylotrophicum]|uniref:Arginase n=1 Tax=Methylobacterium nonmethylotrophicum TaxID=1141884 RepID=A0A4Z0NMG2_9HYPH|nr:arginase family protein [Methylobacterium nonmethylotrophicum]TGD97758.1 arginase [Methylobacterium nonmethylotrophicum]